MADIIWRKVIELAWNVARDRSQVGTQRWNDAMIIVTMTEWMRRGRELNDENLKDLDNAIKRFADETQKIIANSLKDSSNDSWEWISPSDQDDIFRLKDDNNNSIGNVKPPSDPDDIYRPGGNGNSSIGDVTPPSGPDDIYRPASDKDKDKKGSNDKKGEEKKIEEKKSQDQEEEEEEEITDDDDDENNPQNAVAMPAPDGEDDYTGVRRFMPSGSGPGEKDPFDVSDFTSLLIKFVGSGDTKVDAWDRYDGLDGGMKFTGGDEPIPAWEKIGPKF
jgi:hypothetical protein